MGFGGSSGCNHGHGRVRLLSGILLFDQYTPNAPNELARVTLYHQLYQFQGFNCLRAVTVMVTVTGHQGPGNCGIPATAVRGHWHGGPTWPGSHRTVPSISWYYHSALASCTFTIFGKVSGPSHTGLFRITLNQWTGPKCMLQKSYGKQTPLFWIVSNKYLFSPKLASQHPSQSISTI